MYDHLVEGCQLLRARQPNLDLSGSENDSMSIFHELSLGPLAGPRTEYRARFEKSIISLGISSPFKDY